MGPVTRILPLRVRLRPTGRKPVARGGWPQGGRISPSVPQLTGRQCPTRHPSQYPSGSRAYRDRPNGRVSTPWHTGRQSPSGPGWDPGPGTRAVGAQHVPAELVPLAHGLSVPQRPAGPAGSRPAVASRGREVSLTILVRSESRTRRGRTGPGNIERSGERHPSQAYVSESRVNGRVLRRPPRPPPRPVAIPSRAA